MITLFILAIKTVEPTSFGQNESAEEKWKILWMGSCPFLFLYSTYWGIKYSYSWKVHKAVSLLFLTVTIFSEGLMNKVTISSSGYASSVRLLIQQAYFWASIFQVYHIVNTLLEEAIMQAPVSKMLIACVTLCWKQCLRRG